MPKNKYFKIAVDNIARYGDTDIFPYPIEKSMFYDKQKEVVELLMKFNKTLKDFDDFRDDNPITFIKTCVPSGYVGYRLATMIDPLWDACLLALVLRLSTNIERRRIPLNKDTVFSYRLKIEDNEYRLFNKDVNWRMFIETAKTVASNYSYVVKFDIADFYNRVYHHRLENELIRCAGDDRDTVKKIMTILQDISSNTSYGLPVGGNAARILAETVLIPFDSMLNTKRFRFCRYVDDYIIFADSKEDAYKTLNYCAEFLLKNEGLSLSKNKTHIMTQDEFITYAESMLKCSDENANDDQRESFLKLRIHYDPYSNTAQEDYNELKKKIGEHDVVNLIKSEVKKSKIHQAFSKQLFRAVSLLDGDKLDASFQVIMSNLENSLYPVYPNIMTLAYEKLNECSDIVKQLFLDKVCELVENDSFMIESENNAAYTCRVLSLLNSERVCQAIDKLWQRNQPLVKVNCLYAMTNLNVEYWLSDQKQRYNSFEGREKRAFIGASFFISDEGRHWRDSRKRGFDDFETILRDWISDKLNRHNNWKLPL